jgi:hypothetical protein
MQSNKLSEMHKMLPGAQIQISWRTTEGKDRAEQRKLYLREVCLLRGEHQRVRHQQAALLREVDGVRPQPACMFAWFLLLCGILCSMSCYSIECHLRIGEHIGKHRCQLCENSTDRQREQAPPLSLALVQCCFSLRWKHSGWRSAVP